MKNGFKVKNGLFDTILVAVCSFVGVGFITGAEVWFYFARFGINGVFGVLVFAIMIYLLSFLALKEKREVKSKNVSIKMKILFVSELAVASAMVSGIFETTRILFGKWWFLVSLSAIFLLIILFVYEKKSFVIYNYFVAIFVVFVIVSLFLSNNKINLNFNGESLGEISIKNVFLSVIFSLVYVFMNMSEIRPILEKNSSKFSNKKKRFLSLILMLVVIFLIVMLSIVLLKDNEITKHSMPFLISFKTKGGVVLFVFLVGLILTMLSTAQACLIGSKDKLNFFQNDEKFAKIFVMLSSLILGQIPFHFFIKIIYPVLAILNFIVFILEIFQDKKLNKSQKFKF